MVGKEIEPADIGKHQKLIKIAQADMASMDVLVCGKCFDVFHFVEEFQSHKQCGCDKESAQKHSQESKPKVWAFLLWKSTQVNSKDDNGNSTNAWKLYQTWVKMEPSVQETWIVAGKTIQSFTKLGQGNLQEMPVKITKTVIDNSARGNAINSLGAKPAVGKPIIKKDDDLDFPSPVRNDGLKAIRRPNSVVSAPASKLATSTPLVKPANIRSAKRTLAESGELVEDTVEKIVAKRFNPRRRMHEYLVKWENIPHDSNTWEPHQNLENVPQILEIFEKQLARQKEQRAAQQAKQAAAVAAAAKTAELKKEAQLQLSLAQDDSKADISSPNDSWKKSEADISSNSNSGLLAAKRKLDDSDFEDTSVMEQEDFEDDLIPMHTVKRMKNGNTISVRVETKSEAKTITTSQSQPLTVVTQTQPQAQTKITKVVNGFTKSMSNDASSAEVVITKDTSSSGVIKKTTNKSPGPTSTQKTEAQIRVLSKGDNTSSGIIRVGSATATITNGPAVTHSPVITPAPLPVASSSSSSASPHLVQRRPAVNQVLNKSAQQQSKAHVRQTPTSIGNVQITQVQTTRINPNQQQQQVRTTQQQSQQQSNRFTTKITSQNSPSPAAQRLLQSQPKTTIVQRTSMSPGSHQPQSAAKPAMQRTIKSAPSSKNVTPEQKIIQLSKSGDLKVTKKTIPASGVHQKQQMGRPRHEPQSQIQIQKVQQIAPPNPPQQVKRKAPQQQQQQVVQQQLFAMEDEEEPELTLCPQTGQILGRMELTQQQQQNPIQSEVMQAQLIAHGQQQAELTQDMDDLQHAIDLGSFDQQMLASGEGSPILVTGDDGTIYQVAGKNAEGQTILITQGADGEQQYAYVAADEGDAGMMSLDAAMADATTQLLPEQAEALAAAAAAAGHGGETQYIMKQDDGTTIVTDEAGNALQQPLSIKVGSDEDQEGNIPAEVVQADLPSPGGTRRVVLMLPDGTFMVTTMHDDEYQAINATAS